MDAFLYYNHPEHSDIILQFKHGRLYLDSERISSSLAYFSAVPSLKEINSSDVLNAADLFHNEEVLIDLITRAHFRDRFKMNVTVHNWMEYVLLCDVCLDYVLSFLPEFDIDTLDDVFYHYAAANEIPEKIILRVVSRLLDDEVRDCEKHTFRTYCGRCGRYGSMCDNCTYCRSCAASTPVQKYKLIPLLVWLHHNSVNIKEIKNFVERNIGPRCGSDFPKYSSQMLFILR